MDILDQIDRALREVDERGYPTDAMRWVPDGDADQQDAQLYGPYQGDAGSTTAADVLTAMMDRYRLALDNGVLDGRLLDEITVSPAPAIGDGYWRPLGDNGPWRPALPPFPDITSVRRALDEIYTPPPSLPTPEEAAAAFQAIVEGIRSTVRAAGQALGELVVRVHRQLVEAGAIPPQPPADPMARALEARRNRNTGPPQRQRAPRRINPRGHRQ